MATAFFIGGMLILSTMYSGALVAFFSIDVYPSPPESFEAVVEEVREKDLEVNICCYEIQDAMGDSTLDSIQTLLKYVRQRERGAGIANRQGCQLACFYF